MRFCDVVGCGRAHMARGYCSSHYWRWRRGDVRPHVPVNGNLREIDLTDDEMTWIGEVVEALARHALTFVWPALVRGELG